MLTKHPQTSYKPTDATTGFTEDEGNATVSFNNGVTTVQANETISINGGWAYSHYFDFEDVTIDMNSVL